MLFAAPSAFLLGCSPEWQPEGPRTTEVPANLFHATVTQTSTAMALTNVCAMESSREPDTSHSDRIRVTAAAGQELVEELTVEWRTASFPETPAPHPDESFWCADGGAVDRGTLNSVTWDCWQAMDADPAASIQSVTPLDTDYPGTPAAKGYRLTVQVRHAGVLWVTYDARCLAQKYGQDASASQRVFGEMTILP